MTRETVDKYRVHITIGTATVCVMFLIGIAFRIGTELARVNNQLDHHAVQIAELKTKQDEQIRINSRVSESLVRIEGDLKYIKQWVDDLRRSDAPKH